jgi:hypothetical protein
MRDAREKLEKMFLFMPLITSPRMNCDIWGKYSVDLIGAKLFECNNMKGGRRFTGLRYEQGESNAKRAGLRCVPAGDSLGLASQVDIDDLDMDGDKCRVDGAKTQMVCTNSALK